MGIVDFLLAPRADRYGSKTPSEAARIYFIVVILSIAYWAWQVSQGIIFMWFMILIFVATPTLSIGWYIISLLTSGRESRELF
tara:strand:- start:757 stop:1005 length:249 start_codon:yes stop_codon:yes gene_type:complete